MSQGWFVFPTKWAAIQNSRIIKSQSSYSFERVKHGFPRVALHPYLVHYFDSSQPASLAGRPVLKPLAGRPVWGNLAGRPAWENLAGRPPGDSLAGRLLWDTLAAWPQRDDKRRILLTRKSFFFKKSFISKEAWSSMVLKRKVSRWKKNL